MTGMDRELELELVAQLRIGDAAAFDRVHGEFNARLFSFLARLSRSRDVAEDLLEETWLRFVDRAPRLRPDTTLGPFLFTVARNLYVSYCRSRMMEDSQTVDMIGLWPLGTPRPSPFESTMANETGRRIELALSELPALYREALLLVAIEGMRPAEAASGLRGHARGNAPAAEPRSRGDCQTARRAGRTSAGQTERGDDMIEPLPLLTPNAQRGERTVARCHERLARRRSVVRRSNATYLAVERALIGGLCLIYLSGVAVVAIQMLSGR